MNKLRTINGQVVIFVMIVMLTAGTLTFLLFILLYKAGLTGYPFLAFLVPLLVSFVLGTVLSAVTGEMFFRSLKELSAGTKKISKGDFSIRVREVDTATELSDLIKGFNRMAEELGSMEMFRNDFINNISHEIKTPIVSISGFAKQLRNENLSPEKRREYIDIIIAESERLSHMSSNILLLTNYENREIVTDITDFALDEQLRDILILLEGRWGPRGIELDIELENVTISGNREMLSQLWLNLIDNAIKYSKDGGRIKISCRKSGSSAEVEIGDCGIGIGNKELRHIYEKFYQAESSHTSGGNGLGLAIADRVAELHKGRINVISEAGKGTTFTVYLPVQ